MKVISESSEEFGLYKRNKPLWKKYKDLRKSKGAEKKQIWNALNDQERQELRQIAERLK